VLCYRVKRVFAFVLLSNRGRPDERHFGDVEDARQACGVSDVCDPGGAVLRQFRRATASDRELARWIVEQLRGAESKATGTLLKSLDLAGGMGRDESEALQGEMVQSRLIEMEEAEFEKDGQLIKFRKVRLTEAGREVRSGSELLMNDGIVEEFAARGATGPRANKAAPGSSRAGSTNAGGKDAEPVRLSPAG
jgi:hypothetical protein